MILKSVLGGASILRKKRRIKTSISFRMSFAIPRAGARGSRSPLSRFRSSSTETFTAGTDPRVAGSESPTSKLYTLTVDGGRATQVYCAAFSAKMAVEQGWTDCKNLVDASSSLSSRIEVNKHTHRLIYGSSFIGVISSEDRGASGQRVGFALVDELHEHRGPEVLTKIQKGTKSARNPLIYVVTNSGVDRYSICWNYHEWARRVLENSVPGGDVAFADDQLFAYICALDTEDYQEAPGKPPSMEMVARKPQVWIKANPGLGTILQKDYLDKEVRQAVNMPSAQNMTLRLNFCVWTDSASVWIPDDTWMANAVPPGRDLAEELRGQPCTGGLDLAKSRDLSALVLAFPPHGRREKWAYLEWYWIDEGTMRERVERDRVPYDRWATDGFIRTTPGNVTDFAEIKRDILELISPLYSIDAIAYDRAFATQLVTELMDEGFEMVPFGQGFYSMGAPVTEIERQAFGKLCEHSGHPVMRWNIGNVALSHDGAGNPKIDKEVSREKVDGPVALAMAVGWQNRADQPKRKGSVYDSDDRPNGLL